jgi:hypothetical protein
VMMSTPARPSLSTHEWAGIVAERPPARCMRALRLLERAPPGAQRAQQLARGAREHDAIAPRAPPASRRATARSRARQTRRSDFPTNSVRIGPRPADIVRFITYSGRQKTRGTNGVRVASLHGVRMRERFQPLADVHGVGRHAPDILNASPTGLSLEPADGCATPCGGGLGTN